MFSRGAGRLFSYPVYQNYCPEHGIWIFTAPQNRRSRLGPYLLKGLWSNSKFWYVFILLVLECNWLIIPNPLILEVCHVCHNRRWPHPKTGGYISFEHGSKNRTKYILITSFGDASKLDQVEWGLGNKKVYFLKKRYYESYSIRLFLSVKFHQNTCDFQLIIELFWSWQVVCQLLWLSGRVLKQLRIILVLKICLHIFSMSSVPFLVWV